MVVKIFPGVARVLVMVAKNFIQQLLRTVGKMVQGGC